MYPCMFLKNDQSDKPSVVLTADINTHKVIEYDPKAQHLGVVAQMINSNTTEADDNSDIECSMSIEDSSYYSASDYNDYL